MQMGTRPANSQVQYTHYLMCNLDYRQDFILHTGSKITNDHAYKNSTCHQQGIVYKKSACSCDTTNSVCSTHCFMYAETEYG